MQIDASCGCCLPLPAGLTTTLCSTNLASTRFCRRRRRRCCAYVRVHTFCNCWIYKRVVAYIRWGGRGVCIYVVLPPSSLQPTNQLRTYVHQCCVSHTYICAALLCVGCVVWCMTLVTSANERTHRLQTHQNGLLFSLSRSFTARSRSLLLNYPKGS